MRFLKLIFNIILTAVSFLVPSTKRYVIVGGWYGKRYADNSKGVFEYLNANKARLGIKGVFWFTKDLTIYKELKERGRDVLYGFNLRSIFWHLRAAVHIIDQSPHDILGFLSVRKVRINLWHGIPLKSIGHNVFTGETGIKKLFIKLSSGGFWADQYSMAPSLIGAKLLSDGLGVPLDKFFIMTYPRTIPLYNSKNWHNKNVYKVYYLPTFREVQGRCPLLDLNLEEINTRFSNESIQFYAKPHFASRADWEIVGNYSNFHIIEADEDVYENLGSMDLLITDYSSVYFDFMITKKPILFFCYDLEYYKKTDRGFLLPYDEYTPGEKVQDPQELVNILINIKNNEKEYMDRYKEKYEKLNNMMNTFNDKPNLEALDDIFTGM